jgi:hypothetical protein
MRRFFVVSMYPKEEKNKLQRKRGGATNISYYLMIFNNWKKCIKLKS